MEDFDTTDQNAAQHVISDPPPPSAPDSSLSPLEIRGTRDIEKKIGNGISKSDLAMLESLQFGVEVTDDEADNADDSSKGRKRPRREPNTRKRLSLYQVYYLEKSFKIDNKLDTERKYELANELKMKPKQVTIWFQNRRARNKKNKDVDLHIDFDQVLKQYDSLQAESEKLLEENKKLKAEMKDMRHEMVIMKDSLLKYGKLVRAGLLVPQKPKTKPGQIMRTKRLQVGKAQDHGRVMDARQQPQQETQAELVKVNNNVAKEGVLVSPQLQVKQPVNSPASSENSVFDSNSPIAGAQGGQLVLSPLVACTPQPVVEPEVEHAANNTNFMQKGSSVNNADSIDNLIKNLLDLDDQSTFSDNNNNEADHAPQNIAADFRVNAIDMDDETFWQFEL